MVRPTGVTVLPVDLNADSLTKSLIEVPLVDADVTDLLLTFCGLEFVELAPLRAVEGDGTGVFGFEIFAESL